jgi:hypothetical protein
MMKHFMIFMIFIAILLATSTAQAQDACPAGEMLVNGECGVTDINLLQAGWSKIEPGGETACAHGDPYAFWVRPGVTDNLFVFFEGGGGCWGAETCRDTGETFNGFYTSRIDGGPVYQDGILDLDNPENPFVDYTAVYVPVCTGDVHWGDKVADFGDGVVIHFKGFVNAQTALAWAYANVPEPDSIFLGSCSAGSPGSLMHAPYVIEHYPGVPVVQLGDSLSLLMTGPVNFQSLWGAHDRFAQWIPALAEMEPLDWTMARQYIAVANYYPDYTFAQINTVRDEVQVFFTFPDGSGDADDWTPLLEAHLAEIQANAPNYRSFTPGGDVHCVTPRQTFYTYAIDGVRLVDWVADLAVGKEVESLHCEDCARAETSN